MGAASFRGAGAYFYDWWYGPRDVRVLLVGLDSAGKTTILYRAKRGETTPTVPTVGFNVETLEIGGLTVVAWDVGGQDSIRPLWKHYYDGVDAIVFVVDSADRARFKLAGTEMWSMMSTPELRNSLLLVFANKRDLPGSATTAEIVDALELGRLTRAWRAVSCVATTGEGVDGGFAWLAKTLRERRAAEA